MIRRMLLLLLVVVFAAANPAASAIPNKWALVIGIKGYPNFRDGLNFADNDAKDFYEFIQTPIGGAFKKANIKLLSNKDATRLNIFDAIEWLGRHVEMDDTLYVFFSGHGQTDHQGRAFLMPFDSDETRPHVMGIPSDEFLRQLKDTVEPKHMVLFLDACHAGAALMERGMQKGANNNVVLDFEKQWQQLFDNQQQTRMGFFSATSSQRSWEDADLQHGLFTYYLIEALKQAAEAGTDGTVLAGTVKRYVEEHVEARSQQRFKSRQTPIVSPNFNPNFPLALRLRLMPPPMIGSAVEEQATAGKRVALVIGNGAYRNVIRLANPGSDAKAIGQKLLALGFDVTLRSDGGKQALEDDLAVFYRKAKGAAVALFFYAGHGIQVDGRNYLIPIDAEVLRDEAMVHRQAVDLDYVVDRLQKGAQTAVVFLDACRNNPMLESRLMGSTRDIRLGEVRLGEVPRGTVMVLYATSPGRISLDGTPGKHSPFVDALLQHVGDRQPVQVAATLVMKQVRELTGGRQRPEMQGNLDELIYLAGLPAPGCRPRRRWIDCRKKRRMQPHRIRRRSSAPAP